MDRPPRFDKCQVRSDGEDSSIELEENTWYSNSLKYWHHHPVGREYLLPCERDLNRNVSGVRCYRQ